MPWSPRGRGATLRRLLTLWRELEGRRYRPNVAALARDLGVTERTVYRDLGLLEELHMAVPPVRSKTALRLVKARAS